VWLAGDGGAGFKKFPSLIHRRCVGLASDAGVWDWQLWICTAQGRIESGASRAQFGEELASMDDALVRERFGVHDLAAALRLHACRRFLAAAGWMMAGAVLSVLGLSMPTI